MVKPIKKINVAEQAIGKVYELIKERKLRIGDRLPTERELVKMLGISRSSLREGLKVLEMIGVIKIIQGKGTIIENSNLSNAIITPLTFSILLNKNTFLELFESRKLIEVQCAGLAAERITPEELKEVSDIFDLLIEHKNSREESIRYEIMLHEKITNISKNNILENILSSIKRLLRESRDATVPQRGVSRETINSHKKLIAALAKKDSAKARKIMFEHLDIVSKRLEKSYYTA